MTAPSGNSVAATSASPTAAATTGMSSSRDDGATGWAASATPIGPKQSGAGANGAVAGANEPKKPIDPFSDADWTWLNGNPRTKDIYWDTKFFTPEIRADINYVSDFNHPTDHSIGGSSELFRSSEVQLEQLELVVTSTTTMCVRD